MNELQVKEHLRNGELYQPTGGSSPGEEWKHRLLCQYTMKSQIKAIIQERSGFLNPFVYIGVPVTILLAIFAAYLGIIQPEVWLEKIVSVANFNIPPFGLKEIFIFAAAVDCLTLLIWKLESWL